MILLYLSFIAAYALECPKYECSELKKNVCASKKEDVININSVICPKGYECEFKEIEKWQSNSSENKDLMCYKISSTSRRLSKNPSTIGGVHDDFFPGRGTRQNNTHNARPDNEDKNDEDSDNEKPENGNNEKPTISSKYVKCPSRDFKKELKSGFHPKPCKSNNDCELKDGTKSECQCSMNGDSFCKPNMSSDLFEKYWSLCEDNRMTPTIMEQWKIVTEGWVPHLKEPDCAEIVLSDLRIVGNANVEYHIENGEEEGEEDSSDGEGAIALAISALISLILIA